MNIHALIDMQIDRGTVTLQMVQWDDTIKRWVATLNPIGPADGQFGYWSRDSATGVVTLATSADDLNIEETVIAKRILAGGVKAP